MLVVHGGYPARYLLRTDVLKTLLDADVNIVILTPNADEDYFRREFAARNVFVERYHLERCAAYRDGSRIQRMLKVIRHCTLNGRGDLATLDYNFSIVAQAGGPGLRKRVKVAVVGAAIQAARRSWCVRSALIVLESWIFEGRFHRDVFDKYQPDLVVTTSLGYFDFDQFVMREARRVGAPVLAIILSWDNTTSWGMAGARADAAIAWTERMKQELVTYHDFPADRINVCGVAHFDTYFRPPRVSREEFFAMLGLDPARKVILLGSRAPTRYPWNEAIIEMIAQAIETGQLAAECQLLVRVHPIHFRERDGRLVYADVLESYRRLETRFAHLHFDYPRILSRRLPLDMPGDDMDKLAALLRHSSVLVTMLSTLNLEAAVLDLPIVNVCFGGYDEHGAPVLDEPALGVSFTHNKRLISYGATVQVYNEEELLAALNQYLEQPSFLKESRERLALAECGPNRGKAGRIIGEEILRMMNVGQPAQDDDAWDRMSEPAAGANR